MPISLCQTSLIQIILSTTPLNHIRNILMAVLNPCNYNMFTIPTSLTYSATVMDTPTLESRQWAHIKRFNVKFSNIKIYHL